ncbi:MAG: hypothetical protein JWO53_298, partial [Chlamydiia bacterium]|nr:hypothetical protein [Chlamydiia bacterium]
ELFIEEIHALEEKLYIHKARLEKLRQNVVQVKLLKDRMALNFSQKQDNKKKTGTRQHLEYYSHTLTEIVGKIDLHEKKKLEIQDRISKLKKVILQDRPANEKYILPVHHEQAIVSHTVGLMQREMISKQQETFIAQLKMFQGQSELLTAQYELSKKAIQLFTERWQAKIDRCNLYVQTIYQEMEALSKELTFPDHHTNEKVALHARKKLEIRALKAYYIPLYESILKSYQNFARVYEETMLILRRETLSPRPLSGEMKDSSYFQPIEG